MNLKKLIALMCLCAVMTLSGLTACKEGSSSDVDSASSQSNSDNSTTTTTTTTTSASPTETEITAGSEDTLASQSTSSGKTTTTTTTQKGTSDTTSNKPQTSDSSGKTTTTTTKKPSSQSDTTTSTTTATTTTTTTTTTAKPVADPPLDYKDSILDRLDGDMLEVLEAIIDGVEGFEETIVLPDEAVTEDEISQIASIMRMMFPESDLIPYSYSYSISGDGYITKLLMKEYNKTPSQYKNEKASVDAKVNELVKIANSKYSTQFEKALFFHDYIIDNCVYDTSASNAHSAYGCLVEGRAVCEGYAKAFNLLCSEAGIEAIAISGNATSQSGTEPHMWSKVCLDGTWTNIDVTWDDFSGKNASCAIYNYFGLTDSELNFDHNADSLSMLDIPSATSSNANYYVRTGSMISSGAQIDKVVTDVLYKTVEGSEIVFTVRCKDSSVYSEASGFIADSNYANFFAKLRQAKTDVNPSVSATSIVPITHNNSSHLGIITIILKYD